ncbi:TPA: carbamoyltransferase [Candidatus Woesearchaeota archaeon]|nr:carbamoyltransferase [Candidatus Woesearchaeota archaeon]
MNILGISCFYHDSSAALLQDGRVTAAAQEERWTRKKHDIAFPENAIKYCLQEAGITAREVDAVGFYEKPLLKFERLLSSHIETFPKSYKAFVQALPGWVTEKLRIPGILRKKLKYDGKVFFVDHHLAHAASSFHASPFNEAAIFTADGVGEWTTTTLGHGKGSDITLMKEINFPHSLGLLYSAVTAHLGFKVNNDEYKVMGLAPYGKPTYYDQFKTIIDVKEDGSYRLDMSYFTYHHGTRMLSRKFEEKFGPPRKKESAVEERHKDIAASLQKAVEEAIFKAVNHLHALTKTKNLCLAGGVALNSVANGKLTMMTPFKNIYIPPAPSDPGAAVGAATAVYHLLLGKPRVATMEKADLGPSYSHEQIKQFLDNRGVKYTELAEKELLRTVAKLVWDNKVVGWFQGRMEFGERALGNRSILANPCNPEMRDILNLKVKHREQFRPFAPVVTAEDAAKYFDADVDVPFMSFVYPVKEAMRKKLPAITHVDGTGRLQTIRKEHNARYYGVIKEFEKLSGIPVMVNTSFNIRGEPIVMTPEHAYLCFTGTGIDYLAMDTFLIKREDNPKDTWDSESLAKD